MKTPVLLFPLILLVVALAAWNPAALAAPALLDDFSGTAERFLVNDKELGGQSQAKQTSGDGVLALQGELVPERGMPAFVSLPLMLGRFHESHRRFWMRGRSLLAGDVARSPTEIACKQAPTTGYDFF